MPQLVEPQVFLLAETGTVDEGVNGLLDYLNVPNWTTDAVSDAERLIEIAGKLCYLSFSTDLNKNLTKTGTRNNHDYIQKGLIGTKHGSVIEHGYMTFAFMNVSRIFTHELVRHRAGTSFSQVSGRYVRSDVISYWLPSIIRKNQEAVKVFNDVFAYMEMAIKKLEVIFGINEMTDPKQFSLKKILTSAFRRLIGNGQSNHIILTLNHRAFRHIVETRTSIHAEEEIRLGIYKAFNLVKNRHPAIYSDAKEGEIVDGIPEITFEHSKV